MEDPKKRADRLAAEKEAKRQKDIAIRTAWLDKKIIDKLPKEKQAYWANRILGRRGQGVIKKYEAKPSGDAPTYFNAAGEMVVKNRAVRRQRYPSAPYYTKSTHSLRKLRGQI